MHSMYSLSTDFVKLLPKMLIEDLDRADSELMRYSLKVPLFLDSWFIFPVKRARLCSGLCHERKKYILQRTMRALAIKSLCSLRSKSSNMLHYVL